MSVPILTPCPPVRVDPADIPEKMPSLSSLSLSDQPAAPEDVSSPPAPKPATPPAAFSGGCPFGGGGDAPSSKSTRLRPFGLSGLSGQCPFAGKRTPSLDNPHDSTPEQCPFAAKAETAPENPHKPKPESSGIGLCEAGQGNLYYPDYLQLGKILNAQHPVSFAEGNPCHDEMLFITIHQAYELWFKQLIFELDSVRAVLAKLDIGEKSISLALHRLTRVREIQKLLNDQIKVLETMTPQEFLEFRDYLFPASGFQSYQFRLLEIKIGVRPEQRLNSRWIRNMEPEHQEVLRDAQAEPSLFDYIERWLRNIPFREFRGYNFQESYQQAVEKMFEIERQNIGDRLEPKERAALLRELTNTYKQFESVYKREIHEDLIKENHRRMGFRATAASLMIMLYQDEPMFQLPARLLQILIDIDENMNQWRYRHSQMVHRMIGIKMGTHGSLGYSYLKQTLDTQKVFADLANLSTLLIPRRLLPPLPQELKDQMTYFHAVEKYDRTMFEMGSGGDEIDWSFC